MVIADHATISDPTTSLTSVFIVTVVAWTSVSINTLVALTHVTVITLVMFAGTAL